MSPHLVHAVVVHEDATFFEHGGFDEFEIKAALRRSWAERRMVRGASTITTQLARNLYLGTGRSLLRKLREIPLTVRLERALSKRRILELYLNFAEWRPGVFGAEAASRYHFKTSARSLSPARAALMAAALPSPRRSTPARPSPYLRRRAAIILTRMQARGWLTAAEMQAARQELGLRGPAPSSASPQEDSEPPEPAEPAPAPDSPPAEGAGTP
jgi:monofunctional biosynthetic peptidoglycan transglycosylase